MDDKFLFQLHEEPDKEFSLNLQRSLFVIPASSSQTRLANFLSAIKSMRWVRATAILVIGLLVLTTITPARALVANLIDQIGGLSFEVTEDYPGDDSGEITTINPNLLPLDEALAAFPYSIQLPAYMPEGYALNEEQVQIYVGEASGPFANSIELEWIAENEMHIFLRVSDSTPGSGEIVAPGATEEILLDENHPAALIKGGWNADEKTWNDFNHLRILWSFDNLTYALSGPDREQLIQIAQSIID